MKKTTKRTRVEKIEIDACQQRLQEAVQDLETLLAAHFAELKQRKGKRAR
jgi:hypothetical protein